MEILVFRFFQRTALVLLVAATGCSSRAMPVVQTYSVRGTVQLAGAPLPGGRLTLTPVDPTLYGPAEATAEVQPDGSFEPSAIGGSSGLMPGRWKVVVSPKGYRDGKPYRVKATIPAKYTREETTDLVIDVSEGDNHPTLTLRQ